MHIKVPENKNKNIKRKYCTKTLNKIQISSNVKRKFLSVSYLKVLTLSWIDRYCFQGLIKLYVILIYHDINFKCRKQHSNLALTMRYLKYFKIWFFPKTSWQLYMYVQVIRSSQPVILQSRQFLSDFIIIISRIILILNIKSSAPLLCVRQNSKSTVNTGEIIQEAKSVGSSQNTAFNITFI